MHIFRLFLLVALLAIVTTRPADADAPDAAASKAAVAALQEALAKGRVATADLATPAFAKVSLTKDDAKAARELLWKNHVEIVKSDRAAEIRDKVIREDKLAMKLFIADFGKSADGTRSLWISMHGGGGAPPQVNEQQWHNQKMLYRLPEGLYAVPRAPTNSWNLWHEAHIDRMFGRLIEDLVVLADVDPDRVYVFGYSAGGDGAYQLGPRMADRWAGVGMMAGHPNDASPLGLRNVAFALQAGALDAAYNRNKVAADWGKRLDELQAKDKDGYPHYVKLHEGMGHWMNRKDAEALPWLAKHRRNPTPTRVVWKQSGTTHDRLYWLAIPPGKAKGGSLVVAERAGQTVKITEAEGVDTLLVRLDDRMADLDEPIQIECKGKPVAKKVVRRTIATMAQTLAGLGDPKLVFDAEIEAPVGGKE